MRTVPRQCVDKDAGRPGPLPHDALQYLPRSDFSSRSHRQCYSNSSGLKDEELLQRNRDHSQVKESTPDFPSSSIAEGHRG
ncbi:uncharacterized [Tachysurus ichikawai]